MAAINLAGAAIQMAFQKNLSDGITAMFTFFKHTDPMPAGHDTLPSLVQYSTFRSVADIQPGDYFFVPPIANGPNPSLANLANTNQFQLVAVRVTAIDNSFLTVQRSVPLNNNDSAATADANALATYGVIHNRLYFPIPGVVDGIEQIQLLVATQTLLDMLTEADPFIPQAIPIVPPPPAPPGPIDNIANLLAINQGMVASSKDTPAKSIMHARLVSLERIIPQGRFPHVLQSFMFNLPAGQPPSPGYISLHSPIRDLRDFMYQYAQHESSRMVTVTDAKLSGLILLNFGEGDLNIGDFATPSELPLTFLNIENYFQRVCEMIAKTWDSPLPEAILLGVRQLLLLKQLNDCPELIPSDLLELIGRKLHSIDRFA